MYNLNLITSIRIQFKTNIITNLFFFDKKQKIDFLSPLRNSSSSIINVYKFYKTDFDVDTEINLHDLKFSNLKSKIKKKKNSDLAFV